MSKEAVCRIAAVEIAKERGVDSKAFRAALRESGKFPAHEKGDEWTVDYGSEDHHKMIDVMGALIRRQRNNP